MRTRLAILFTLWSGLAFAANPECLAVLKKAGEGGLILSMKATPDGMEFVVNEDLWSGIAFRSKEGLVRNINCGLLDDGKVFNPIIFRSHRTNKIIGKQDMGKLTIPD